MPLVSNVTIENNSERYVSTCNASLEIFDLERNEIVDGEGGTKTSFKARVEQRQPAPGLPAILPYGVMKGHFNMINPDHTFEKNFSMAILRFKLAALCFEVPLISLFIVFYRLCYFYSLLNTSLFSHCRPLSSHYIFNKTLLLVIKF
jgi:uncharacterized protein affecting Mg2+/Co2+ transport